MSTIKQPIYDRQGRPIDGVSTADVVDVIYLHDIIEDYSMSDYYSLVSGREVEKIQDDNECTFTPAFDEDGVLIGVMFDEHDPSYHPSQEHDYYEDR